MFSQITFSDMVVLSDCRHNFSFLGRFTRAVLDTIIPLVLFPSIEILSRVINFSQFR